MIYLCTYNIYTSTVHILFPGSYKLFILPLCLMMEKNMLGIMLDAERIKSMPECIIMPTLASWSMPQTHLQGSGVPRPGDLSQTAECACALEAGIPHACIIDESPTPMDASARQEYDWTFERNYKLAFGYFAKQFNVQSLVWKRRGRVRGSLRSLPQRRGLVLEVNLSWEIRNLAKIILCGPMYCNLYRPNGIDILCIHIVQWTGEVFFFLHRCAGTGNYISPVDQIKLHISGEDKMCAWDWINLKSAVD